jgi:hypothetical protein
VTLSQAGEARVNGYLFVLKRSLNLGLGWRRRHRSPALAG